MARRNTKQSEQANAEATSAEAPQATDEQTTQAPAEVDLTAFQTATQEAVATRDESTGEVPLANIEPVNQQYRALDGIKPKNQAKAWLEEQMKAAITSLDVQLARAYTMVKDNLSAATKTSTPREPADPTQAYVNRVAAHRLALSLVESNVPEGVDSDKAQVQADELVTNLSEQVEQYRTWVNYTPAEGEEKPEAPEVSPVVRSAFKLSQGKAAGGSRATGGTGVRRDIGKHIASAFADLDSGAFLTIAEIANHKSEEYGDDSPSQGAVSARLFPQSGKSTVEGVIPVSAEDSPKKVRGAKKA